MGRTPVPLTILVWAPWADRPEMQALAAKGHAIIPMDGIDDVDVILHPSAHWWGDLMWERPMFLETALKRARQRRREADKSHPG